MVWECVCVSGEPMQSARLDNEDDDANDDNLLQTL